MMKSINNFFSYKIVYFFIFIFLLLFLSYLNFSINKQIYYKNNTSFTIAEGQTVSKSIQLLKEGSGQLGLITPNAWLMVTSGENLRKYILML